MPIYWVTMSDGRKGTVETKQGEDLGPVLVELGEVSDIRRIPYPARPGLRRVSDCPEFCYRPSRCMGRSSCPNAPSCTS